MKGMSKILKQAQKLQEEMGKTQQALSEKNVEASSGGGMVTVVVNGHQELVSIKIESEVTKSADVEMLQDLVLSAVNEGIRKSRRMAEEEISKVTGGLSLPDGMPNLFGG